MSTNQQSALDVQTLSEFHDQHGVSLLDRSRQSPVLVVFLRHSGCPFCRQTLGDLRAHRGKIERTGSKIALVHMAPAETAGAWFAEYELDDVSRFSDPERVLYRAFDLHDGSLIQVMGPQTWLRGFKAVVTEGHFFGLPAGHEMQLPGTFLILDGRILRAFRHQSSADRPDYADLATCDAAACRSSS